MEIDGEKLVLRIGKFASEQRKKELLVINSDSIPLALMINSPCSSLVYGDSY